jgi:hypothetical protein
MNSKQLSGIEILRRTVKLFDSNAESFNLEYSAEELIQIARACWESGWDCWPDAWTKEQVEKAIKGESPQFEERAHGLHAVGVSDCNCRDCRFTKIAGQDEMYTYHREHEERGEKGAIKTIGPNLFEPRLHCSICVAEWKRRL